MSSATKFATYLKGGWHKFWSGEYSTTLPVLADGERAIAQVDAGGRLKVDGRKHKLITVAPVTNAAAYGAGDGIGGLLTIANAVRLPALSGVLKSISANFKSDNITATVRIALFKANPSASTFASRSLPNCGKRRDQGVERTSTSTLTSPARSRSTKRSIGWFEWPMVLIGFMTAGGARGR